MRLQQILLSLAFREATQAVAEYYAHIGDKDKSLKWYDDTLSKTVGKMNPRIANVPLDNEMVLPQAQERKSQSCLQKFMLPCFGMTANYSAN